MAASTNDYMSRITQSVNTYKSGTSDATQTTNNLSDRIKQALLDMQKLQDETRK